MRRVLWILLLFSFLYGFIRGVERYRAERENRNVEIALDYDAFQDLCQRENLPIKQTLKRFKALGVSTVAPSEMTIEKLHQSGEILWIRGEDLPLYPAFDAGSFPRSFRASPVSPYPSVLLETKDPVEQKWLSDALPAMLGAGRVKEERSGFSILGKADDVTEAGLGIYPPQTRNFASLGFGLSPRIYNPDDATAEKTGYLAKRTTLLPGVTDIIFSGTRSEALGYDSEIPLVAKRFRDSGVNFGFLETYDNAHAQRGAEALARLIPDRLVKVQGLAFPQTTRWDPAKALDMFMLGVKERNIRVIYFRPFLVDFNGESLLATNVNFLRSLRSELLRNGFVLGKAEPFASQPIEFWDLLIPGIGVVAGLFILIDLFLLISPAWAVSTFAAFVAAAAAAHFIKGESTFRSVMAFTAGNLFPILGIVLFFPNGAKSFKDAVIGLLKTTLMTVGGGLLVSAMLTNNLTILGIETFHGVKMLFVIPVIFGPWLAWLYRTEKERSKTLMQSWRKLVHLIGRPVYAYHLALLALLGVVGVIIMVRSGNVTPEGAVPQWEKTLRSFLEVVFVARPRFKEFLIGHPFFLLASLFGFERYWGVLLLILGSFGQADIMDSFAHLHTSLQITGLRTFHGLWLGILIGALLWVWAKKTWRNRTT